VIELEDPSEINAERSALDDILRQWVRQV